MPNVATSSDGERDAAAPLIAACAMCPSVDALRMHCMNLAFEYAVTTRRRAYR